MTMYINKVSNIEQLNESLTIVHGKSIFDSSFAADCAGVNVPICHPFSRKTPLHLRQNSRKTHRITLSFFLESIQS